MASTPSPPNPQQTAAAQTAENVDTAIANNSMSHVDQTDQWGDKTNYTINGYTSMTDPESGTVYQLPNYSESTTLSPTEQSIYGNLQTAELGAGQTADSLISQAQTGIAKPLSLENYSPTQANLSASNVDDYISKSWEQPFNYQEKQQQEQLNQNLADQGININDPAYATAQNNFAQQEQMQQDTYANAMYGTAAQDLLQQNQLNNTNSLNAANQYNQNQVTQHNQPINELSALLSQSQVSNPTFQQTSTPQIPTTDYAQIAQQSYQDQLAASQQQNSIMGSLFGLGGTLLGGLI